MAQTLNFTPFAREHFTGEDWWTRYVVASACEYVLFPNPDVALGLQGGVILAFAALYRYLIRLAASLPGGIYLF